MNDSNEFPGAPKMATPGQMAEIGAAILAKRDESCRLVEGLARDMDALTIRFWRDNWFTVEGREVNVTVTMRSSLAEHHGLGLADALQRAFDAA